MNAYLSGLLQIVMVMAVEILNLSTILACDQIYLVVGESCAYIVIRSAFDWQES